MSYNAKPMVCLTEIDPQVEVVEGLTTIGYLCQLFKRTPLCINQWIAREHMPVVKVPGDERPAIRFNLERVKAWAKQHGKRMYLVEEVVS